MTEGTKRKPEKADSSSLVAPRRPPPSRQRPRQSTTTTTTKKKKKKNSRQQASFGNESDDVMRTMKQQQNQRVTMRPSHNNNNMHRKMAAEDGAMRIARMASLEDNDNDNDMKNYDSRRWETLVSKQEELMESHQDNNGTKPSSQQQQQRRFAPTTFPSLSSIPSPLQTPQDEQILPGAFRMRPTMGPAPARGLEEGDHGDHREFAASAESRRSVGGEKDDTLRESDDILIEATLVSDTTTTDLPSSSSSRQQDGDSAAVFTDEPELVTAHPMKFMYHDSHQNQRRWILVGLMVGFVILLLIVGGILVGVSRNNHQGEDAESTTPTMAPTSFVQDVLPVYTQQALLSDPTSPQSRAYDSYQNDLNEVGSELVSMEAYFPLQRFALATLYYALGGDDWMDKDLWLETGTEPCDWYTSFYGTVCTNGRRTRSLRALATSRPYYQRLSLYKNNLVGTLPPELSLLSELDVVNLHGNAISGTIPSELGLLRDVTLLQLFNNSMTGTLPTELSQLSQIRHLNFAFNQLSGTIPPQLGQLSSTLEVFSVSNNRVEGTIPTQLGRLSKLEGLHLYNNPNLGGFLPSELGLLTKLQILQLNGIPNLMGTIPTELGFMHAATEIQLHDTKLSGTIPTFLGLLSQLTKLTLHNTNLSGDVPKELCMNTRQLIELTVDCDKVQCPVGCRCDCGRSSDSRGVDEAAAEQVPVAAELITDPPITVSGTVGAAPDAEEPLGLVRPTSAAVIPATTVSTTAEPGN